MANPERKRRFALEAKAASALNHPNIITIYDIDVADGVDFIAMEYVAGQYAGGLDPAQRHGTGEGDAVRSQIADALATAHQSGIVHRDLKPSNIMVNAQGRVKVLDFGLAKLIEPVSGERAATRTVQTREGTILGTVSYMAPEQAEGKPVDQRADIFSFGAVLYEMLSGVQPFRRDSDLGTLAAILRDEPPALDAVRIPPAIRQVVKRALEKNPEARYESGAELASALASLSRPVAPRGALNRRWLAVGAAAVGLAAILGGRHLYKQNRVDWARREGLPQIARLLAEDKGLAAFDLAQQVASAHPGRPGLSAGLGGSRPQAVSDRPSRRAPRSTSANWGMRRSPGATSAPRRSRSAPAAWLLPVESRQTRFRRDDWSGPHLVVCGELAAGAGGRGSRRHGSRAGRRFSRGDDRHRGCRRAARPLLHRPVRSDQPAIQTVRRPRRLSEAGILEDAVRQGRKAGFLGRGDGCVSRHNRPAWSLHLGRRHLSDGK